MKIDFEANKSPLEKWPGTLLIHKVHGSLSSLETTVASLGSGKEQPQHILEDLKKLRNSLKVIVIAVKA